MSDQPPPLAAARILLLFLLACVAEAEPSFKEDWTRWEDYQLDRYEYVNYWRPYGDGPKTVALFHFDGAAADLDELDIDALGGADAAKPDRELLPGVVPDAENGSALLFRDSGRFGGTIANAADLPVTNGYFRQGVRLAGNPVRVRPGVILFQSASGGGIEVFPRVLIEFWLKLDRLPDERAYLVRKQHRPGKENEFTLALDPDGSLHFVSLSHWTSRFPTDGEKGTHAFREYREAHSAAAVITPGTWQHVALYSGADRFSGPINRVSVWVNGDEVAARDRGWGLSGEDEFHELALGEGLAGTFDELRIMMDTWRRFYPVPDDTFTDPEARRTLESDPRYVAPAQDILFHAPFEGTIEPDISADPEPLLRKGRPVFRPGVRGQALYVTPGQAFHYKAARNVQPRRGTIEMWVRPVGWSGHHRPQHNFFRLDAKPNGLGIWIVNSGFNAPTVVFGGDGHSGAGAGSRYVDYPPDTWTHLVQTWDGNDSRYYVNGNLAIAHFWQKNFDEHVLEPQGFRLPNGPILVDEYAIYSRALTATEVLNHYRRYFPDPALARLQTDPDVGYLQTTDFPGVGRIRLVPFFRFATAEIVSLHAALRRDDGRVAAEQTIPWSRFGDFVLGGVPLDLHGNNYVVEVAPRDRDGNSPGTVRARFSRPRFEWLGNELGMTDRVLKPYEPIRVGGGRVTPVGRTHTLDGLGLFRSIDAVGEELLASPMRIDVTAGGVLTRVEAPGAANALDSRPHLARWEGRASGGDVRFSCAASMDVDGMTRFRLAYEPAGAAVTLDRVTLVIPLKTEYARLYFLTGPYGARHLFNVIPPMGELPREEGEIFRSDRAYADWKPTRGSFLPQLWVGNDERGLTFLADSDRGWVPSDAFPSLQIVRRGGTAELRLNIVTEPHELAAARTIDFGLQATPVRPLPAYWRSVSLDVGAPKGVKLPDDLKPKPYGSFDVGRIDEGGVDRCEFDPAGVRRKIEELRKANTMACPHLDTAMFNWGHLAPDCPYDYFAAEWSSCGPGFNWIFTRSKVDWGVWSHNRWRERFGIDGVYHDTGTLRHNYNIYSGTAYRLEDGRIQPGWTCWGQREYFKRSCHLFGDIGTECFTRGCGFYGSPFAAWQYGCNLGEQPPPKPGQVFYEMVSFPFPVQRTVAVPPKWGHLQMWMPPNGSYRQNSASRKFLRSYYAQLLQLDVRTVFTTYRFPFVMADFGIHRLDTVFHPFWRNTAWLDLSLVIPSRETSAPSPLGGEGRGEGDHHEPADRDTFVGSAYRRGDDLLFILSNLGRESRWVEASIRLQPLDVAPPPYRCEDTETAELEFAFRGNYHEDYCWKRGGVALVGVPDDVFLEQLASRDVAPADVTAVVERDGAAETTGDELLAELEDEPTDAELRRIEFEQPSPDTLKLRLYLPLEDYRIVRLRPVGANDPPNKEEHQ